jgi:hypothetical protein
LKVKPLQFVVTEYISAPRALASLQLTHMKDSPLHSQPILVRFLNNSVGVCFFERDGTYTHTKEIIRGDSGGSDKKSSLVPDEFERVPIPHIHRDESLVERLEKLKKANKDISHLNDYLRI